MDRSPVIDLTQSPRDLVAKIEAAPAYELLLSLVTYCHRERRSFTVGAPWFRRADKAASADLKRSIAGFAGDFYKIWAHLLGLVYRAPHPKTVPAFLKHLEGCDPLELRLHLMGYFLRAQRGGATLETMDRAARGVTAAQEELLKASFPEDPQWQGMLSRLLARAPEETKDHLVDILHRWYRDVFHGQEAGVVAILESDAKAKDALRSSLPPLQLVEQVTHGVEYHPEPGIRTILLVPTLVFRPWVLVSEHLDTKIFCYPVDDESLTAHGSPPPERMASLHRALADETRLLILRHLAFHPSTLQEVADRFGLAKSTVHYHLGLLRAAGLLRVREGPEKRYTLRQDQMSRWSRWLEAFFNVEEPASPGPPRKTHSKGSAQR